MRIVSFGLGTVLVLACGDQDRDQSLIDPNFRNPGAQPDPSADGNAKPSAEDDGAAPAESEPAPGDDAQMTSPPELSTCGDAPASARCPAETPGDNAAATNTQRPPGSTGPDGADGGGTEGNDTPDGSSNDSGVGGTGGSGGVTNGAAGAGGSGGSDSSGGSKGGASGAEASGGSGAETSGGSGAEPLPDLILDGAYLMATIQQDTVDASADLCLFNEGCVTGDGLRRVVRFGTRSANVGEADVVVGEPVAGNPLWEFDACHRHFHFEGYARYDLVNADSGEVLPIGNKNGFCLRDLDSWSDPSCGTYDCDYQGISAGCADVYTPDLDCQWVDITDVAPGTYDLVVTVNTERSIHEQSFDNNSATVTIEILPTTIRVVP